MQLIKFCKKEHNISLGCNTLHLGTLEYYRNLDPAFSIADPEEGINNINVSTYTPENASPEIRNLLPFPKNSTKVSYCRFLIPKLFPNSFIFCTSIFDNFDPTNKGKDFDPTYDSFYFISNVDRFSTKIASILLESVKCIDFVEDLAESMSLLDIKEIGIQIIHSSVNYSLQKHDTIHNSQLVNNPNGLTIEHYLFTKNEKYKNDHEYRIAFLFVHPQRGVLAIKRPFLLLNLNSLTKECIA